MTRTQALDQALELYKTYYDINCGTPARPFAAEAEFCHHSEQYFLVKGAKLAETDAREVVFFATPETLTEEGFRALDEAAWEEGMRRVNPSPNHRSTDVSLVILAEQMTEEAAEAVRRSRHSKSYRFGLRGYSSYRVIVYALQTGAKAWNRLGRDLRKNIDNIASN